MYLNYTNAAYLIPDTSYLIPDSMNLYRDILKEAWSITKKYRALWFFGLFVAPVANGGVFEILYQSLRLNPIKDGNWLGAILETLSGFNIIDSITALFQRFAHLNAQGQPSILLLTIVALGAIVLFWLTIVSVDALVSGARMASKNEQLTIREGLKVGHTSFWAVSTTIVVALIVINAVFLLIRAGLSIPSPRIGISIPIAIALLALMAILAVIYFIAFYTVAFIVLKRLPITKALSQSIQLLRQYWLVNIELSAALYVMALAVGMIGTFLMGLFLNLPLTFLLYSGVRSGLFTPDVAQGLAYLLQLVISLLVIGLWGLISVFQMSSWTLLFLQLNKKTIFESTTVQIGKSLQKMIQRPQSTDVLE